MSTAPLDVAVTKTGLRIETGTGWLLERSRAEIHTDRGVSRPGGTKRPALGLVHTFHVEHLNRGAFEVFQTLKNPVRRRCGLRQVVMLDGRLRVEGAGWRVFHSELFKVESYFDGFSQFTGDLFGPLPGTTGEYGLSEDTPFPGIAFTHPERGTVLMATLTQARCKPVWRLQSAPGGAELTALDAFTGIPAIPLGAGETFESERWVVLFVKGGVEDAIERYYDLLSRRHHFYGPDSVLRDEVVWGSWNYNYRPGGHGDIDHKYIVANARALTKLHKRARWIMIDAGYQIPKPDMANSCDFICLEIFDPDTPTPHHPKRFPKGMVHTASEIRRAGAKPAIWLSPRVHADGRVASREPEWLLRVKGGREFWRGGGYLDYSIPEVREYTRNVWESVFLDWGYDGLKLDFWTPAFEPPDLRFRNKDKTAIELRNLFLQDIREFVPEGGYLLTCCVVNAGNPFLGLYADSSRMGQDMGDGEWRAVIDAALWASVANLFYDNRCLLPDPDSIGWHPDLKEAENRIWATAALMTGGMCELGGDLTRLTPEARRFLTSVCERFGPAERSRSNVCQVLGPASRWSLTRPGGDYEALLNWRPLPLLLPQASRKKDLWTGEPVGRRLPPHGARLWRG